MTPRPARGDAPVTVPDPRDPRQQVNCWAVSPDPGTVDLFGVVAIVFPRALDDEEEADTAAGLFGYAWAVHGAPRHTGTAADRLIVWPQPHIMVAATPWERRPERSRTRAQAARDLLADLHRFVQQGTPQRRDGTRLVAPVPNIDPADIRLFTGGRG